MVSKGCILKSAISPATPPAISVSVYHHIPHSMRELTQFLERKKMHKYVPIRESSSTSSATVVHQLLASSL